MSSANNRYRMKLGKATMELVDYGDNPDLTRLIDMFKDTVKKAGGKVTVVCVTEIEL